MISFQTVTNIANYADQRPFLFTNFPPYATDCRLLSCVLSVLSCYLCVSACVSVCVSVCVCAL